MPHISQNHKLVSLAALPAPERQLLREAIYPRTVLITVKKTARRGLGSCSTG